MEKNETLNQRTCKNLKRKQFFKINQTRCFVPTCSSKYIFGQSLDIRFYKFPSRQYQYRRWKRAVQNSSEPCETSKVCSLHFRPEDFQKSVPNRWHIPTLKVNAIPSLHLPEIPVVPSRRKPQPTLSNQSAYRTRLSTGTVTPRRLIEDDIACDLKAGSVSNRSNNANKPKPGSSVSSGGTRSDNHNSDAEKVNYLLFNCDEVIKREPTEPDNFSKSSVASDVTVPSKKNKRKSKRKLPPKKEYLKRQKNYLTEDATSSVVCDDLVIKTEPVNTDDSVDGDSSSELRSRNYWSSISEKFSIGGSSDPPQVKEEPVEDNGNSSSEQRTWNGRRSTLPTHGNLDSVTEEKQPNTDGGLKKIGLHPCRRASTSVRSPRKTKLKTTAHADRFFNSRKVHQQLPNGHVRAPLPSRPRPLIQRCCVPGCSSAPLSGVRRPLFSFPSNPTWHGRWLDSIFGDSPSAQDKKDEVSSSVVPLPVRMPFEAYNALFKIPGCSPASIKPVRNNVSVLVRLRPELRRRNAMVCSAHFRDGKPTAKNPLPDLNVNGKVEVDEGVEVKPDVHVDHTYADTSEAVRSCAGSREEKPMSSIQKMFNNKVLYPKSMSILEPSGCSPPIDGQNVLRKQLLAKKETLMISREETSTLPVSKTSHLPVSETPRLPVPETPRLLVPVMPCLPVSKTPSPLVLEMPRLPVSNVPRPPVSKTPRLPVSEATVKAKTRDPANLNDVSQDHNYAILTDVKNSESAIWGQYNVSPLAQACYTAGSLPTETFADDQEMLQVRIKKEVEDEDTRSNPLVTDQCFASHWQQTPTIKQEPMSTDFEPPDRTTSFESSNSSSGDVFACISDPIKREPVDEVTDSDSCGNFQFVDMGSFMSDYKTEFEELGTLDSIFTSS